MSKIFRIKKIRRQKKPNNKFFKKLFFCSNLKQIDFLNQQSNKKKILGFETSFFR